MRRILLTLCLLANASEAFAQVGALRAGVPAPAAMETTPVFTRTLPNCLMTGVPFTAEGQHLLAWKEKTPVLVEGNNRIELDVLQRHDTRYTMRLPAADIIKSGRKYRLAMIDPRRPQQLEETSLMLHLCPVQAMALSKERDILILMRAPEKPKLESWLRDRGMAWSEEHVLRALGDIMFVLPAPANAKEILKSLRKDFPDADIDWNNDLSAASTPRLYAAKTIGWQQNGSCADKAKSLPIGLLDGRVDTSHPAFSGRDITSKNFLNDGMAADTAHATAIASILVGNAPDAGLNGLLPDNELYSATVLRSESGKQLASIGSVIKGLDWLMDKKLRLIGISLATQTENAVLNRAFNAAAQRGAIIFAAAGNNASAAPVWPAALPKTIAITAVDANKKLFTKANRGKHIDFAAPGVDVWVASGDTGNYESGTSLAVPYALAAAAVTLAANPAQSRDVVYGQLKQNASRLENGILMVSANNLCE